MTEAAEFIPDPVATVVSEAELVDLTRLRVTNLSDDVIGMAHWIAQGKWDYAAKRAVSARQHLELLGGYLVQLVGPNLPEEAPPTPERAAKATAELVKTFRKCPPGKGKV